MNFKFIDTPQGSYRGKKLVTVDTFFESEGNIGYFKRETFNSMILQMNEKAPNLLKQYNSLFQCVKDGFNIRNTVTKQTHLVNGQEYYHLRLGKGKVFIPTTIYDVENIGKFIEDYSNGLIQTNFSLAELFEASKKH